MLTTSSFPSHRHLPNPSTGFSSSSSLSLPSSRYHSSRPSSPTRIASHVTATSPQYQQRNRDPNAHPPSSLLPPPQMAPRTSMITPPSSDILGSAAGTPTVAHNHTSPPSPTSIPSTVFAQQQSQPSTGGTSGGLDKSKIPRPYKCPLCDRAFYRLEHQVCAPFTFRHSSFFLEDDIIIFPSFRFCLAFASHIRDANRYSYFICRTCHLPPFRSLGCGPSHVYAQTMTRLNPMRPRGLPASRRNFGTHFLLVALSLSALRPILYPARYVSTLDTRNHILWAEQTKTTHPTRSPPRA